MKTWILILALVGTSCARQIVDNELIVGDGSGADVTITADVGNVNNPKIEYDFVSGAWRFSNDGVSFDVFGSAASDVLTTNGDLLYYNSGYQRLGIGTEGQLLTMSSGLPAWIDAPVSTTLDTKGQLQGFSTINAAVGPCADGQTLVYDALEATGWKCGIALPDQTGNGGKYLRTNGTVSAWQNVNNDTADIKTNLLLCPSFEGCGLSTDSWVVTTDASFDGSGTGVRTIEPSAYNDSELKFEGLISPTWDIKAVMTKTVNFSGQQMKAYCEIRTLRPDVKFIAGANAVSAGEQNVINDNKWRFYEVFLVGGDTSQYIEINGETTASSEPIYIDNCFIGKVSPTDIRQLDIAMTDWVSFTPTGAWTTNTTYAGVWRRVGDTYQFRIRISLSGAPNAAGLTVDFLKSGLSVNTTKRLGTSAPKTVGFGVARSGGVDFDILATYASGNSLTVITKLASSTYTGASTAVSATLPASFTNGDSVEIEGEVPIVGWDVESNTIVTQNTELTAKTANEFVANVSSTGVVSGENFDWINGNCTNAIPMVCTFNTGHFAVQPVCTVSMDKTSLGEIAAVSTSSSVTIYRGNSGGTAEATSGFALKCTRSSTDYNKSATIIGKFENINSSELVKVIAIGNNGASTGGGDVNFTEVEDNSNSWNGTVFTPPKTSFYLIEGAVAGSAATNNNVFLRDVASSSDIARCSATTNESVWKFTCLEKLNASQQVSIRAGNITLSNNTSHRLNITELPDTESIIKNLNDQNAELITYRSSAQSIPNNTFTSVVFDSIDSKSNIEYNSTTGVLTIQRSGLYEMKSCVKFPSGGYVAGSSFEMTLYKNSVAYKNISSQPFVSNTALNRVCGSVVFRATIGQTFDFRVRHNFGAATNIDSGDANSFMSAVMLSK